MEGYYHTPDLFRYCVNSFIRSIREVPQLLSMELQNHTHYKSKFKQIIYSVNQDDLLALLHRKRDFIVHRGMLELFSEGMVGTTEGRVSKLEFPSAYILMNRVRTHTNDLKTFADRINLSEDLQGLIVTRGRASCVIGGYRSSRV
jgi:hypothetical protein